MNLSENLLGQKCRPQGAPPQPANATPEDYYYTVVACWLEQNGLGNSQKLMCALVSDATGGTNIMSFADLEFSDLEWT